MPPTTPTFTITDEGYSIGVPVRVMWTNFGDERDRPIPDRTATLPGHRIVETGYSERHRDDYTSHTGIVIPLRPWDQPIGGYDEGTWPYVDVRPATDTEARDLLAAEERTETIRGLVTRFTEIKSELARAHQWAEPDLSHVDISDCADHIADTIEEYREGERHSIRAHRHIRNLDGYVLAVPGADGYSRVVIYRDRDLGVVWESNVAWRTLRPFRYEGELAEIVDQLVPLLECVPASPAGT